MKTVRLQHGRVELALHRLRNGDGPCLLLLHELGGRAPRDVPREAEGWPGTIWALDFTGHGDSSVPRGGGYTAEILMADADVALASTGPATVLGYGLGAYVALLLAGSRPELVRGAVLCDGAGLQGGGPEPSDVGDICARPRPEPGGSTDPQALAELSRDVRPPGYARLFLRQAVHRSQATPPITVACGIERPPPWLESALAEPGTAEWPPADALESYSRIALND